MYYQHEELLSEIYDLFTVFINTYAGDRLVALLVYTNTLLKERRARRLYPPTITFRESLYELQYAGLRAAQLPPLHYTYCYRFNAKYITLNDL